LRTFGQPHQLPPRFSAHVVFAGDLLQVLAHNRVDGRLLLRGVGADLVEHFVVHRERDIFHNSLHSSTGPV